MEVPVMFVSLRNALVLFVAAVISTNTAAEVIHRGDAEVAIPLLYSRPDLAPQIDFNGDGRTDVTIQCNWAVLIGLGASGGMESGSASFLLPANNLAWVNPRDAFPSLIPLQNGDTLSLQPVGDQGWYNGYPYFFLGYSLDSWSISNGSALPRLWNNTDTTGFDRIIGLQFAAADGVHLGWMRLSFLPGDSASAYPRMVLDEWAYETVPGTAITVVGVPEPSLSIPALIMGFLFLRLRSKGHKSMR